MTDLLLNNDKLVIKNSKIEKQMTNTTIKYS